jgi:hypothetical protein
VLQILTGTADTALIFNYFFKVGFLPEKQAINSPALQPVCIKFKMPNAGGQNRRPSGAKTIKAGGDGFAKSRVLPAHNPTAQTQPHTQPVLTTAGRTRRLQFRNSPDFDEEM